MSKRVRDGALLDIYGGLLTEKQRMACEMVLLCDLSLSEAGESIGVSRQAVHDLVVKSKEKMEDLEKVLKLLDKDEKIKKVLKILEDNRQCPAGIFYDEIKSLLE